MDSPKTPRAKGGAKSPRLLGLRPGFSAVCLMSLAIACLFPALAITYAPLDNNLRTAVLSSVGKWGTTFGLVSYDAMGWSDDTRMLGAIDGEDMDGQPELDEDTEDAVAAEPSHSDANMSIAPDRDNRPKPSVNIGVERGGSNKPRRKRDVSSMPSLRPIPVLPRIKNRGQFNERGTNAALPDVGPHAIVTMVAGRAAARHAVALVQSLRDTNCSVPVIVLLQQGGHGSDECRDSAWMRARGRAGISCTGPDTVAEEIVSPRVLRLLQAQGAHLVVGRTVPRTKFTSAIQGGTRDFWGMSLNRLQVFGWSRYDKLLYMDADTLVLQNIDHLFGPEYPMFTAAMTYPCCDNTAAAHPSGGLWVIQPSRSLWARTWHLMAHGMPMYDRAGAPLLRADGSPRRSTWYRSDMDIAIALFTDPLSRRGGGSGSPRWPQLDDSRHGKATGLHLLPESRQRKARSRGSEHSIQSAFQPPRGWNASEPVWRALDIRYDQCVGNCECLPGRDLRDDYVTVHFSCIQHNLHKPGHFSNERDFMDNLYYRATSCTRDYYLRFYLPALQRGGYRLGAPRWTGPRVPLVNKTHDSLVVAPFRRGGHRRRKRKS